MMTLVKESFQVYIVLTVLTGIAYPLTITFMAQTFFPYQANGSLITEKHGTKIIGSELIGQEFKDQKYFWSRPSASAPFPYNAGASSGSNLGPLNPDLLATVKKRIATLQKAHGPAPVPMDLVTSSASGLDPHISTDAAEYQVDRVAQARGLPADRIRTLIKEHTAHRQFGVLGEEGVNVVTLNLALDTQQ